MEALVDTLMFFYGGWVDGPLLSKRARAVIEDTSPGDLNQPCNTRWPAPGSHRDPFDRMLIAQAQEEHITISNEVLFDSYGVRRIW